MLLLSYIIKKISQKTLPSRQEGGPVLKLRTVLDYPDMSADPFEFKSNNLFLRGFRYSIGPGPYKGVMIFFHGLNAGHYAYEDEIHSLAKEGYLVYAYDNECCGISDGEHWWALSSALINQRDFFKWLDSDEKAQGLKRYTIGHSWGGFVALCSLQKEYKVDKVCSMSGFGNIIKACIHEMPKIKYMAFLLRIAYFRYYGKYGNMNAHKLLKKSEIPVLLVHGDLDDTVEYKDNFLDIKEKLSYKNNISYLVSKDRYHQPYMTIEAQNYYRYLVISGIAKGLVNPVPEIDYDKLINEDKEIMRQIFDFFDK